MKTKSDNGGEVPQFFGSQSNEWLQLNMVVRRHDLDAARERARETAFDLAKEIAKKSAHGAREMDRFIRPQFGHDRKRMAEWNEIMQRWESYPTDLK
jgi:hypothetical protein